MTHSSPLRIGVISHTGLVSGAEMVLLHYIDAMIAEDWEVIGISPVGFLNDEFENRGLAAHTIPELKLPGGPKPLAAGRLLARWLAAAPTVRRATSSCDLIVVNGLLALPSVKLAGRRAKAAWLVHDVVVRGDHRRIAAWSGPGIAAAAGVSEASAAFPASLGIPTSVIRNGTTWPVKPAPLELGHPPVVGINAMVTRWKGHHVLLEAAAGLPDVVIELMGGQFPKDGPYVNELRRRADQADLHGRVRFLGHVEDPLETMRSWNVAVSASVDPEAGPLAVLEAMSIGVPVAATNHGGAPEVVGDAGILVTPGDPVELRSAIGKLLADPELRRRCHDAGRATVGAGLTREASDQNFLSFLRQLTGESVPL